MYNKSGTFNILLLHSNKYMCSCFGYREWVIVPLISEFSNFIVHCTLHFELTALVEKALSFLHPTYNSVQSIQMIQLLEDEIVQFMVPGLYNTTTPHPNGVLSIPTCPVGLSDQNQVNCENYYQSHLGTAINTKPVNSSPKPTAVILLATPVGCFPSWA